MARTGRRAFVAGALLPCAIWCAAAGAQQSPGTAAEPTGLSIACAISRTAQQGIRECSRLGAAQRCGHEADFPSRPTPEPTALTITNRSFQIIKLYWLDRTGSRVLYSTVMPGGHIRQQSHIGANWVVTDQAGGCIGIFNAAPIEIAIF